MTGDRERARWLAHNVVPHEAALRAWLFRQRSPSIEVDDIVQETYAILAGLESVNHILNPRNYVFQTARSVLLRQLRRDKVVKFQQLTEADYRAPMSAEESPEAMAILKDNLRRADVLLGSMPDRVREAFILRRVDGLSQRQIAQVMQVSENTVEKHIGKAIRIVMQAVKNGYGGKHDPCVSNAATEPAIASARKTGPEESRGHRTVERDRRRSR